jgi:hypothetical protein
MLNNEVLSVLLHGISETTKRILTKFSASAYSTLMYSSETKPFSFSEVLVCKYMKSVGTYSWPAINQAR